MESRHTLILLALISRKLYIELIFIALYFRFFTASFIISPIDRSLGGRKLVFFFYFSPKMFSFLKVLNESKLANITREKSLINSIWLATNGFSRSSLIPLVARYVQD